MDSNTSFGKQYLREIKRYMHKMCILLQQYAKLHLSIKQSMQQMGNSRGRAVYEARLPEDFRRPQSDQQMDTFIRSKYEKKKYIALEWTPSKPPDLPQGW